MRYLMATMLAGSMALFAAHAQAADGMTIAVFTKNSTNPAYEAFRIAADQIARTAGARVVHLVPKKPDNVDEQKAMVEQVLKDRPDAVIFIPVDDVAMIDFGEAAQRGQNPGHAGFQSLARQFRHLCRRRRF